MLSSLVPLEAGKLILLFNGSFLAVYDAIPLAHSYAV